jgi:CDP-diacylglycerol--serine O-phosphatidyltransferase
VVLDLLDGRIARLTGTTSQFGAELDSLADAISFGVAPALMAYRWALDEIPRLGWLAAFFFAMCGVLRLARFNVQKSGIDPRYFVGLPIPAAAGQLVTLLVVGLGFLMVSTFRYPSFKGVDLRRRRSYLAVLGIAIFFIFVFANFEYSLLALASLYTLWAPGSYLFGLLFRRRGSPPPAAIATGEAR